MAEPVPPPGLAALQADFSAAARTPLALDDAGDYLLPVERYPAAIAARIVSARGQPGAVRLGTYNQQYWFRLLTVMQEEYPLLSRLMGLLDFNRMVIDFLTAHPSSHPTLRHLSDPLVGFLMASSAWGSAQRVQCARLEHAYIVAFDAAALPPPAAVSLTAPLRLQPYLRLHAEDWDLVMWRKRVREDADVAVVLAARAGWWMIGRAPRGRLTATPLTALQFRLLTRLAAGQPLAVACTDLAGPEEEATLAAEVGGWLAGWAKRGWFAQEAR